MATLGRRRRRCRRRRGKFADADQAQCSRLAQVGHTQSYESHKI